MCDADKGKAAASEAHAGCRHRRISTAGFDDVYCTDRSGFAILMHVADDIELALVRHFELIGRDNVAAAEMYAPEAVLEYVQSGERIRGRANIVASREAYPGRPAGYEVHRVAGAGDTRTVEMTLRFDGAEPHPLVAVVDLLDGRITRERIYIAEPWDPPEYRAPWVEPL